MADEAPGCETGVEIPQPQRLVPGRRQGKLAVRRDDDIGHKVVMAVQDALWVAVVAGLASELPDEDCLVTGSGQD